MPKFTVEFNDALAQKITELANKKGVSKTDVLRRALTLYDYADKNTSDSDKQLSITRGEKKLQDIVLP